MSNVHSRRLFKKIIYAFLFLSIISVICIILIPSGVVTFLDTIPIKFLLILFTEALIVLGLSAAYKYYYEFSHV